MNIHIIRTNGSREVHKGEDNSDIRVLIGADTLDFVNLRDGRMMAVDDQGYDKDLPVNPEATELYHSVCLPGTTHEIVGDVAIVPKR